MKVLRWLGGLTVVAYLTVWISAVPLFRLFGPIYRVEECHHILPESMFVPALLAAAGNDARQIRILLPRPFFEETPYLNPLVRGFVAECCRPIPEALKREDGYFDLTVIEDFPYFFSEEAERELFLEFYRRTRPGGIVVLPYRMLPYLPASASVPRVLPGDDGSGFVAVSVGAEHFPDTDPEELERRLQLLAGEAYWPLGIYPAVYPSPARRIDVPPAVPRRPPLGSGPFRAVLAAAVAAALLWLGLRLSLARRESVAWMLCRGENAAAFALALLLAAQMSCRLEYRIGATPWDILLLLPLFWCGGGLFFRGRAVSWAALLTAAALLCFLRETWLAAGHGWVFFGILLLTVLVAASERRLLRQERPLSFRRAFFAEAGGFAVALGLWLLLRDQSFGCRLVGLGIPAVIFRLAACRNLF